MAKRRKLIKLRYVAAAAILLVVMLIPKYNHFSEAIEKGNADTSYGLTTAYDFLMYRMLAQEADLTWEIDRQVWIDGDIDPERAFDVAKEIIGIPTEVNSTQYLMNRGCSSSALTIYSYSTATVTGGYPILWAAIFGYFFAIPFLIVDSYLLFLVIRCIFTFVVAKYALLIIGGEKYVTAVPLLRAFIPLLFFSFPSILFGWPALGAIGKEKETTFTTIITAFLQIGGLLALLLIGQFNVIDLALLRGFTEACMFAMRYRYCRRFKGEFAI